MKTKEEVLRYCLKLKHTYPDMPFHDPNWVVVRRRESKKIFAWIFEKDGAVWVNLKMDPEWRDFWRTAFPSVLPAYHLNKKHWSSVILDGSIPDREVKRMIKESYDLVQKGSDFAKDVYRAVCLIPEGKVATYGQIAAMAHHPGAARAVGSLLKKPEAADCPCHRVVNSRGGMAPPGTFSQKGGQEGLLEKEGVEVKGGMVDLSRFGIKERV